MKKYAVWPIVVILGVVNALIFWGFEYSVNHGTAKIWDDLFHTNTHRWKAVPIAILLGFLFSWLLRLLKQQRVIKPKINSLQHDEKLKNVTLWAIAIILIVGLGSLLAGAALGPEAALVASSTAIGVWFAEKIKTSDTANVLVMASVGALLVAFFNTLLLILFPLFLLYRQKKLRIKSAALVILAGLCSYDTFALIDKNHHGYGSIPTATTKVTLKDFIMAIVLGFVMVFVAFVLKWFIGRVAIIAKNLDHKTPWPVSAGLFGLVIGVLYWIAGPTIEFSGQQGSATLLHNSAQYTVWALLGFVIAKLIVTGWSIGTGYRGGLIFPSVFIGVAMGLATAHIATGLHGPGATIGSVSGMMSAMMGSSVIGAIIVSALLPGKLIILAIVSIAGTILGKRTLDKLPIKL